MVRTWLHVVVGVPACRVYELKPHVRFRVLTIHLLRLDIMQSANPPARGRFECAERSRWGMDVVDVGLGTCREGL